MNILFIHPAYPNQFTAIAHGMAGIPGIKCAFLTEQANIPQVIKDHVPISYYGYSKDGETGKDCWYLTSYEEGLRHGKAVADTLPKVMETFLPDLVIGHGSFGTTLYIKDLFGLPVISYVELPGYHMAWCRKEFPALPEHKILNTAFQSLVYAACLKSDRVIVPSFHAGNQFPDELKPKIRVRMEGFNLPPIYDDKKSLKKKIGLDENRPVLGFASRTLEAMRGFDVFMKAACLIKQVRPDVQVLVIGSEQTLYGNELTYLGGKSFKRFVMDELHLNDDFFIHRDYLEFKAFHEHLQAMDLILFPLFEGAANWGLFEAMASGTPVITTDRCFLPEVINHGMDGFMFDPYDLHSIVSTSLSILSDPDVYVFMGQNARETIRNRYTIEHSIAGYLGIVNEIIG